jgi:CDP-glycerol glycerophosphotransferase (TagB/SpsB family)
MHKHDLFFISLAYSYSILRPLQEEIWRRGDEVAWFIEEPCEDLLEKNERRLHTIREVMDYNPIAVFAPGNWVYDFFPGVKVQVFHGYAMKKRIEKIDDHFTIRGWFDIYCTQGPSSTPYFKELERKYGFFKVYETGWCKVDPFFEKIKIPARERPVILYSPTFSSKITSAPLLLETITQLAETKPWDWIITFHPKLDDPDLLQKYRQLAETHANVTFYRSNDGLNTFRKIDVLLCDSSSIVVEAMLLEKPVVTFRNTHPGNFLINVLNENEIAAAIEEALTRSADLMENIRIYTAHHEAHRDGRNSARVLDAVDDFILNYKGKIKKKPLNLFRKIKLRLKIKAYGLLFRL